MRKGAPNSNGDIIAVTSAVTVFSPLDQTLQLGKHSWSPATLAKAIQLGVEIASYERAAQLFDEFTQLPMSKSSMQRVVSRYGKKVADQFESEAAALMKVPRKEEEVTWRTPPEPDSTYMNVSIDGVMVNLIDEGWGPRGTPTKITTISAVEPVIDDETGEISVQLTRHSYRAGLWEAPAFANHLWVESCRRGLEKAQYLMSVNDGAPWIWAVVFLCFARCTQILDWWHAVQRLWSIAHVAFADDPTAAHLWVEAQKRLLAQSQLRQVIHHVRLLFPRTQPLPDPVRKAVAYYFHNRWRMVYRHFRAAGYPIGSGTVESACKLVVQQRMKQPGMRWRRANAQAMLALRSALFSDRWCLLHDALKAA